MGSSENVFFHLTFHLLVFPRNEVFKLSFSKLDQLGVVFDGFAEASQNQPDFPSVGVLDSLSVNDPVNFLPQLIVPQDFHEELDPAQVPHVHFALEQSLDDQLSKPLLEVEEVFVLNILVEELSYVELVIGDFYAVVGCRNEVVQLAPFVLTQLGAQLFLALISHL